MGITQSTRTRRPGRYCFWNCIESCRRKGDIFEEGGYFKKIINYMVTAFDSEDSVLCRMDIISVVAKLEKFVKFGDSSQAKRYILQKTLERTKEKKFLNPLENKLRDRR